MIYLSLEPGLLILTGLAPHESKTAIGVVNSLIMHRQKLESVSALIPMTKLFLEKVYKELDRIPISNPPLQSQFRGYVIALLSKISNPPLPPAAIAASTCNPEIISNWISDDIRDLWLDCVTSALFETLTTDESGKTICFATWSRERMPSFVRLKNKTLQEIVGSGEDSWKIPLFLDQLDWDEFLCNMKGWPSGLASSLIDAYARKNLGIPRQDIGKRKEITFSKSCQQNLDNERDVEIQRLIIDTISCKAYNVLRPHHRDEPVLAKKGERRLSVRRNRPPVRLHYKTNTKEICFVMYTNGDHDQGL